MRSDSVSTRTIPAEGCARSACSVVGFLCGVGGAVWWCTLLLLRCVRGNRFFQSTLRSGFGETTTKTWSPDVGARKSMARCLPERLASVNTRNPKQHLQLPRKCALSASPFGRQAQRLTPCTLRPVAFILFLFLRLSAFRKSLVVLDTSQHRFHHVLFRRTTTACRRTGPQTLLNHKHSTLKPRYMPQTPRNAKPS